jgi:lipopolysaccharide biosynthesis regulator YciM
MNFDLEWLLIALPVAFGLGWLGSRLDLRQWKREQRDAPKAYFKGLNLLLNEQQDKAIDAFIEAVQHDADTTELHFALGNLFRRRGEYERAVRVHQHLLQRGDLPSAERERAQHALAQDFLKAGLFDRAEQAYKALEGTPFELEAKLALLTLYERSREWAQAIAIAQQLERTGTGSFASRIAHYWCELALEAEAARRDDESQRALQRAREAAPQSARGHVLTGQCLARQGRHEQAMAAYAQLLALNPDAFNLVARDYADAALACGQQASAHSTLLAQYQRAPSMPLLLALERVETDPPAQCQRLMEHLRTQPLLSAAQRLLAARSQALPETETALINSALERANRPLQRYRCAACGFEAQHYFWQCPGCLGWDTYPPRRVEEL